MSRICKSPGYIPARYVVDWRRRIPSHELMLLGMPGSDDLSFRKTDSRTEIGKWFWRS